MVRSPIAGRVKTRLAREIGTVPATQFYRHTATAVITRLSRSPRWRTILSVVPDAGYLPAHWVRGAQRRGQGGGGLGRRMQRIMDLTGPGPVVIVGTDIPSIECAHIASAFNALGRADAVFGPADDGGYWLVGLRRSPRVPSIFGKVRWSSEYALADTKANLAGRAAVDVATLCDVDSPSDLARDRGRHGRVVRGAPGFARYRN